MTGRPTAPHAVRLAGLRKTYGDTVAVDGLDLEVAPGEIVALLGPNGAGKSTTVDLILGLSRPDTGTVAVFGRGPRDAVDDGLVGAMLQDGAMLEDATVGEMVALFAAVQPHPLPVADVLARAGLTDLANRQATELSGGQAQRVRFALALVPDPDLVVLDEPTVAMDVATRREFWAAMRRFAAAGKTVLFATHYLDEADGFADRIVLLRDGSVVADGTPRHIKSIVAVRTVRAVVPDLPSSALTELFGTDGVTVADTGAGHEVRIRTADGDGVLRTLLAHSPGAHDIEVTGADLEEAFVTLTDGRTAR
ncbi:ABC transporter ATP-binding protein [Jiangella mangrovi]|uniref:ABC-2 type transport system ATP-binding protein n=1 Tax=Jiangella mangrovi TaxID=1524084 RepID=A0A7W9LJ30_9ACTN|nr:ABC transporter ATP-binding protein [Jiangella mangrovi]MBB5785696.1 ABC-2 type transport system ATP-binding protein [Jiangella mangrovi]